METNDNTLLEMQQQMQQLRDKLDKQKIVNERMLNRACSRNLDVLRTKARVPIFAGLAIVFGAASFHNLGLSLAFMIFTAIAGVAGVVAASLVNANLPKMDQDLVSAGEGLAKFRRAQENWMKYSIPVGVIWLVWLLTELFLQSRSDSETVWMIVAGLAFGLVVGILLGRKNRRAIFKNTDELLAQIEELKKGE
jgi:uncharacterized membrane protein